MYLPTFESQSPEFMDVYGPAFMTAYYVVARMTRHAMVDLKHASTERIIRWANQEFGDYLLSPSNPAVVLRLRALFAARDFRRDGPRRPFRIILVYLANNAPDILRPHLSDIPIVGRWDDLFPLINTTLCDSVIKLIKDRLSKDRYWYSVGDYPKISTLAKWLPSENASSPKTRALAKRMIALLNTTPRAYRAQLSTLRAQLNLLETRLTNKNYDAITYDTVTFGNRAKAMSFKSRLARSARQDQLYKEIADMMSKEGLSHTKLLDYIAANPDTAPESWKEYMKTIGW